MSVRCPPAHVDLEGGGADALLVVVEEVAEDVEDAVEEQRPVF